MCWFDVSILRGLIFTLLLRLPKFPAVRRQIGGPFLAGGKKANAGERIRADGCAAGDGNGESGLCFR